MTFIFGFGGYLAGYYGLVDLTDSNQINAAIFGLYQTGPLMTIPLPIVVVLSLIICIMNQMAIDGFQNAIQNIIVSIPASGWGYEMPILATRAFNFLLNTALIAVGCLGINITKLFLLTHILAVSSVAPVLLGFVPYFDCILTGNSCLLGSFIAILSVIILGRLENQSEGPLSYFFSTHYSIKPFITAFITSIFAAFFFAFLEMIWKVVAGKEICPPKLQEKLVVEDELSKRAFFTERLSLERRQNVIARGASATSLQESNISQVTIR